MRGNLRVVLVLLAVGCVMLSACSRTEETATAEREPEPEPLDETAEAAARTRGVPDEGFGRETPQPQVVLNEARYEWKNAPERGLQVTLDFINPVDTYERARGYVFVVAEATLHGSTTETGVYPWNTRMDGELPENYEDGAHLLYRETQTVRGFIPIRGSGVYNKMRLYVFSEDGRLLTNRSYDLQITGESGESKSIRPGFDL